MGRLAINHIRRFLYNLAPTSLFSRFILIIVLPAIIAQLIATYIFYHRHWDSVSRNMAASLAKDIKTIYELKIHNVDPKLYDKLSIDLNTKPYNPSQKIIESHPSETHLLYNYLKKQFPYPIQIKYHNDDSIKIDIFISKDPQQNILYPDDFDDDPLEQNIPPDFDKKYTKKNTVLSFIVGSKRVYNPTTYIFIILMTGVNLLFLLLSIIFTKNQIRPIIKLAHAADKFGKGQHSLNFKPEGAKEIRKAASAFLKMKERIARQISYRTAMLAGVSHDLRTPLTRMKLQLAISNDPELKQMEEDIKDMEQMINSYLDFARGDMHETMKMVHFNKFLAHIIAPYLQLDLTILKNSSIKLNLRTDAIKRCFQNLLDNAFKYGNKVILHYYKEEDELRIEIHDNGIGIPIDKREEVFKPFFRLDESRNKETGGVGLGLAITHDIINNHGGQIHLESSELLGGLKVVISLPI